MPDTARRKELTPGAGLMSSDPTALTTQQLGTAIDSLRDILNGRIDGLVETRAAHFTGINSRVDGIVETIQVRFEAMDKALLLLQGFANRVPTIGELNAQFGQKFESILEKFALFDRIWSEHFSKIDQQFKDQTAATALALSAADKGILNAYHTAERAAAKAELAAEKGYLEAQIAALREAFSTQIRTQKDALEAALSASDKAVLKAETATEKRFESVNEFRATLSDQQRDLATKSEVQLRFKALEDRMNTVVEDQRELKGRSSGIAAGWGYLVGAIGAGAAIVTLIVLLVKTSPPIINNPPPQISIPR